MSLLNAPTLAHYLVLGAILFAISMAGIFLNRRNVIIMLMAIELMLLAVNLNFIAFSRYLDDMAGQVFVFFILTVAAAESAIGLAILVLLFRNAGSIDVEDLGTNSRADAGSASTMQHSISLVPLAPLVASIVVGLLGPQARPQRRRTGSASSASPSSFVASFVDLARRAWPATCSTATSMRGCRPATSSSRSAS